MICADFLAGANLENENPEVLLQSVLRFFKFLPGEERKTFFDHVAEEPSSMKLYLDVGYLAGTCYLLADRKEMCVR